MENNNRREFLKNTAATIAGFAIACAVLLTTVLFNRRKDKAKLAAAEDYSNLAYCCLNCSTCDLFIATRDNNENLRAKVAEQWQMNKNENFKLEDFLCYGCKASKPGYFDAHCTVKKCAIKKGLQICALCENFDSCDEKLWKDFPEVRRKAESVRAKLHS